MLWRLTCAATESSQAGDSRYTAGARRSGSTCIHTRQYCGGNALHVPRLNIAERHLRHRDELLGTHAKGNIS